MKKCGVLFSVLTFLTVISLSHSALAQQAVEAPGQIAYIGSDFNVYILRPQDGTRAVLSDDAIFTQTQASIYEWPMWSADGQLAYVHSTIASSGEVAVEILVSSDAQSPGQVVYSGEQEYFTYASWSPQPCTAACDLALLLNDPTGLAVKLVHLENGESVSTLAGEGAPFYSSWSPDGSQMVWQRNNAQFEIFDVGAGSVSATLEQLPGRMFTPEWSPVDDRLLLGIRRETSTELVILDGTETTLLATAPNNPLWFSWSPDASHVAYIDRQGPVIVLDAASGAEVARSPDEGVIAFFWSPDSQRLAYISLAAPVGSFTASAEPKSLTLKNAVLRQPTEPSGLSWSVLDVADGATRRYPSFFPTNQQVYLLQYFDQFAISHHVWSPDSRFLVYSALTQDMRPVINLLDTSLETAVPVEVAEGLIGIWSFN